MAASKREAQSDGLAAFGEGLLWLGVRGGDRKQDRSAADLAALHKFGCNWRSGTPWNLFVCPSIHSVARSRVVCTWVGALKDLGLGAHELLVSARRSRDRWLHRTHGHGYAKVRPQLGASEGEPYR
jgi:hypothetical protein